MGLLDSVIGAVVNSQGGQGGAQGGGADLLNAVIGMLGNNNAGGLGGIAGLVEKFQQSGLGDVAKSWVSTGQNMPVSPDQLGGVLGDDMIAGLSRQTGVNQGDLLGQLAQMLPQVVDKLTPNGQVPQGNIQDALGGAGLGDLAGMLGGLLKR
jgi:uncharacterized protein YidB (DUF937 family)